MISMNRLAWLGDIDGIRQRLDAGTDIEERDHCGSTALRGAVWGNRRATIHFLINRGADLDAFGTHGSILHMCSDNDNKHVDAAKFIVEAGCRTDMLDRHGKTPLQRARQVKNHRLVEYLESRSRDNVLRALLILHADVDDIYYVPLAVLKLVAEFTSE